MKLRKHSTPHSIVTVSQYSIYESRERHFGIRKIAFMTSHDSQKKLNGCHPITWRLWHLRPYDTVTIIFGDNKTLVTLSVNWAGSTCRLNLWLKFNSWFWFPSVMAIKNQPITTWNDAAESIFLIGQKFDQLKLIDRLVISKVERWLIDYVISYARNQEFKLKIRFHEMF